MADSLLAETEQKKLASESDSVSEPAWMSDPTMVDILDNGLECPQVD